MGRVNSVMLRFVVLLTRVAGAFLWFGALYHYGLLVASLLPRRRRARQEQPPRNRFAVVIPAHNEAAVIGRTVRQLLQMDYPKTLFDVIVVADHCRDDTAQQVRESGGVCHERLEGPRGRKGYALAWLMDRVVREEQWDAVVVLDADSQVDHDMLSAFDRELQCGTRVMQGQHMIVNMEDSAYNTLAAVDMRINNRLRNLARDNLGFSSRLMGDAMCFHIDVLRRYPWNTFSLVEDIEYGIKLMESGIRIGYVPDAVSWGEAAGSWRQAEKQRLRWEGGVLDVKRRLAIHLLRIGASERRGELLDRGFELLLPPFSLLSLGSGLLLVVGTLLRRSKQPVKTRYSILLPAAYAAFPIAVLFADRAPRPLYRGLIQAPLYLVWRVWIRVLAVIRRDSVTWVRTPRKMEK